jgi:hypothetical protein
MRSVLPGYGDRKNHARDADCGEEVVPMTQKALESAENREQFLADLYEWLSAESDTVMRCSEVQRETNNSLVRLVAEIIQGNSRTHIRILNLIHECLTKKAISLTPDELGQIWDLVVDHLELERKSVDMAERAVRISRIFVIKQLLTYMVEDKSRDLKLLNQLENFKRSLYPYL